MNITQTMDSPDGTQSIAGSAVLVRKGNAFVGLASIHVGNDAGLTASDLDAIMRKAVAKL